MKYKEYQINSDGYLERCIRCKNKKIIGDFCHICGAPVRNFCSDNYYAEDNYDTCRHSEHLLGNARFCPDCGSKSTFFQKEILPDWNIEYNEFVEAEELNAKIQNSQLNSASKSDGFMTIPDRIDDELPFN